jgi:hypothetical protein
MTLALDEGLGFRAGVDQRTAALVPLLDGDRPLRQSIDAAANAFAFGSEDREAFTRGALGVVREMLELGFVVRAEEGPHPTEGADELLFDTGPSR